jgi:hypothetical protein
MRGSVREHGVCGDKPLTRPLGTLSRKGRGEDGGCDAANDHTHHVDGFAGYFRRFSMASQIIGAMSGPPKRLISRMPVGEVTLISVR